jgi:hypothetical protein
MKLSIDVDNYCGPPDMLSYHGNFYRASLNTRAPRRVSFLGPLPNLTESIKESHALVRLGPVHRTGADLKLRLQNHVLAIIRCRETCVLDVQISIGLVAVGLGNISAGYISC